MTSLNSKPECNLHESIKTFNLDLVKQAFEQDECSLNILDTNIGWSALYKAVVYEQLGITQFLLEKGADPNLPNKIGECPLHYAAEIGKIDFVKTLLKYGANPNLKQSDGNTSLHVACKKNHIEAIKLMLKCKADTNIQNKLGRTPLHFVANNDNTEAYELLLKYKADPEIKDKWGRKAKQLVALKKEISIEKKEQEVRNIPVLQEPTPKKCEIQEVMHSCSHKKEEPVIINKEIIKESRILQEIPSKRSDIKENIPQKKPEIRTINREAVKGMRVSQEFVPNKNENKEEIHQKLRESYNKENIFKVDQAQNFHRRAESNKIKAQKKKEEPTQNILGANKKNEILDKNFHQDRILGDVTNHQIHHVSQSTYPADQSNSQKSRAEQLIHEYNQEKKDNDDPNIISKDHNSIKSRISNLRAKLNEQPTNLMKKSRNQALTITIDGKEESMKKTIDSENKKNYSQKFVGKGSNNLDNEKENYKNKVIEEQSVFNHQENIVDSIQKKENLSFKEYMEKYQRLESPKKTKQIKEELIKEKPEIKQNVSSLEESWSTNTSPKEKESENVIQTFEKKQEQGLFSSQIKLQLLNVTPLLNHSSTSETSPTKNQFCVLSQKDKTFLDSLTNKTTTAAQTKHILTPKNSHHERHNISAGKMFNNRLFSIFCEESVNKNRDSKILKEQNVLQEIDSHLKNINNEIMMVDWLAEIDLEELKLNFIDTGYSQYSKFKKDYGKCKTIFDDLLRKFGIDKFGHRCRIIMKLREDCGLFPMKGAFLLNKTNNYKKLKYPTVHQWLNGIGLNEYVENFIDNGFDNLEYIILQTDFKEMPFDEFLMRDELNIENEIIWTNITKKLSHVYDLASKMRPDNINSELLVEILARKDDPKSCSIF